MYQEIYLENKMHHINVPDFEVSLRLYKQNTFHKKNDINFRPATRYTSSVLNKFSSKDLRFF